MLLLDEPASGLDPRARIEMRELLKELKRMGKTILISSHILHELAELCNTVGIIERGKLLFSGTVKQAVERAGLQRVVRLAVTERPKEAAKLLNDVRGVKKIALAEGDGGAPEIHLALSDDATIDVTELPSRLISAGFRLRSFSEEPVNLETVFMRLTKGLIQ